MLGVGDVVGGLQIAAAIGTAVILRKVLSRGRYCRGKVMLRELRMG